MGRRFDPYREDWLICGKVLFYKAFSHFMIDFDPDMVENLFF
ncbi:aldo/keto reductase [Streptococcus ruminantium]|uniref:Aldo/keto reductase n=1 Tax=Streptococcus ruminantium TaxID=1917441 RepID=A0A2Z5U1L8_9STRE|nr:aldo/keto reductase [Streptococcus ruminantium]